MIEYSSSCIALTISEYRGRTSIKNYYTSIRTTRLFAELFAKSSMLTMSPPWSPFLLLMRNDIERVLVISKFADDAVTSDPFAGGLGSRGFPRLLPSDSPCCKRPDILLHHRWKVCFIVKLCAPPVSYSGQATLWSNISNDTM